MCSSFVSGGECGDGCRLLDVMLVCGICLHVAMVCVCVCSVHVGLLGLQSLPHIHSYFSLAGTMLVCMLNKAYTSSTGFQFIECLRSKRMSVSHHLERKTIL